MLVYILEWYCKAFNDLRSMVGKPREATDDILAVVHTEEYLKSLKVFIFRLIFLVRL